MPARHRLAPLALLLPATLAGCGSLEYSVDESHVATADTPSEQATAWLPEPGGPKSIGTSTRWIDTADRSLPIQLWYPTDQAIGERMPHMSNPVAGVLRSRTGELIPGGAEPGDELLATRVHDVDAAISYLAGGGDAVLDSIDGNRVAVLGHSYGGATAAQVAAINPAVRAVGVLDATVLGTVAAEGLDVPTLLLTAGDLDPTRERFWDLLTGPRTGWQLNRAGHFTFTDLATLIPALGPADSLSTFGIGTDPNSTSTAVRELARSFLDQHLDSDTDVSDQFRPIS